jgi:excisionase family DNA binding protein
METYGLRDAARLARCHPDTLRKLAHAGIVPATKIGRPWLFPIHLFNQWIENQCRKQAEEFARVLEERLWRQRKLGGRAAISWNEANTRWLTDCARPRMRDRWFLKWLKDEIGEYTVSAVADPSVLEELRKNGLADGWAHPTVDRMMRTVRGHTWK